MNNFLNIGYGNFVSVDKIVAIISPDSAPIKRLIQEAREKGILVDATCGRKTRAVIVTDCERIVLSAMQPETVVNRIETNEE